MTDNLQEKIARGPETGDAFAPPRRTLSLATARDGGTPARLARSLTSHQMHADRRGDCAESTVDTVPLTRLTGGRKALRIAHAGETYLLRITKSNKRILTKPGAGALPAPVVNT